MPELFYPNEGDDEDPMRGRETRESATSSAPDSWTSVEFREIDGVKRVVGLSLDNRLLKEVPMTHLKKLDALESLDLTANELYGLPTEFGHLQGETEKAGNPGVAGWCSYRPRCSSSTNWRN